MIEKGDFVPDLSRIEFRVYEDKTPKEISMFSIRNVPVTMGLIIDKSGSTREKARR